MSDSRPYQSALRMGGTIGATILTAPFIYYIFSVAGNLAATAVGLNSVGAGYLTLFAGALAALIATLAALALAGTSLYGRSWLSRYGQLWFLGQVGAVFIALLATAVLAGDHFAQAIDWGLSSGDPFVVLIGVSGLASLAWATVRALRAFRSGYLQAG